MAKDLEDSDYKEWNANGLVKYWSVCALNSITNSFGGQLGNCSATTYHWGKMTNVGYPNQGTGHVTFALYAGSLWDHLDFNIDWDACGFFPAEGEQGSKIGEALYKGGDTFTWSLYLTNTRNFGANTGTHYFRAFTTTMASEGIGEQCKSIVPPDGGAYGLPTN